MNRCDKCQYWLEMAGGYGKCLKRRWTTAGWFGQDCDLFQAPSPPVADVVEPEEPVSDLLVLYGDGKGK